jgi:hypothetical protein
VDSQTAIAIAGLASSAATGLGGVYLGSRLSRQTARDLARDQREWDELHAIRQRKDEEAAKLDKHFQEALAELPRMVGPAGEVGEKIRVARNNMLRVFGSGTVFDDPETTDRVHALSIAMLVASDQAEMLDHGSRRASGDQEPRLNPWPLTVGVGEVREALSCFQRHVDPPDAMFPTANEVLQLATRDGEEVGLDGVWEVLRERLRAGAS